MSDDLEIVRNPAYAGLQPSLLHPACHDQSPLLDVRCTCGADSHVHETQLKEVPGDAMIGVRCSGCSNILTIQAKTLKAAFRQMRKEGWST